MKIEEIEVLKVFREATHWDKDGEIVLRSGRATGRVYFTGGKIAWLAVSTIDRTFTRYLTDHSKLKEEEVQGVYEDCSRTGKNLAETVVEWGLLEEDTVRRLLLEHISECLIELFSWPQIESMFMPEARSYGQKLTFDFVEVLKTASRFDTEGKLPFGNVSIDEVIAKMEQMDPTEQVVGRTGEMRVAKRGRGKLVVFTLVLLVLGAAGVGGWLFRDKVFDLLGMQDPWKDPAPAVDGGTDLTADGAVADAGQTGPPHTADGAAGTTDGDVPDAGPGAHVDGATDADSAGSAQGDGDGIAAEPLSGIVAGASGHGEATVRVISKPARAKIYLDGIYTGKKTPALLEKVAAGRDHVIQVERKGRRPAHLKFTLEADKRKTVKLYPKRRGKKWKGLGTVKFVSDPEGALVIYNKKSTKKRTPTDIRLPLGKSSKIELRRFGFKKWSRTIRPIPGEDLTILVHLQGK